MRRIALTAAALGLVVLLPALGSAAEPPPGAKVQDVSGTVAVPNPSKAIGAVSITRHARTAGLIGSETNGGFGWFFDVEPRTWGGEFVLDSTTAGADMDVIFYTDPGTVTAAPVAAAEFVGVDGDGERGVVPAGATHALVYASGVPNAAFTYAGHAVPQIEIGGAGPVDLTVPVGGSVEWVNKTADYTSVTGVLAGKQVFSSGTGPGSGIPVGKSYTAVLAKKGVYTYTTSVGTGTVTVV